MDMMAIYGEAEKVRPFSKCIADRAITLLGHIFRSNDDDLLKRIAIDASYKRVEREKRRVGRPRFFWLATTMKRAHKFIRKCKGLAKVVFDMHNANMREEVAEAALNREHPFDKKHKSRKPNVKKGSARRDLQRTGPSLLSVTPFSESAGIQRPPRALPILL